MKKTTMLICGLAFGLLMSNALSAANNASATVTYTVAAMNSLEVSGSLPTFAFTTIPPGSLVPDPITNTDTHLLFSTNGSGKKITGEFVTAGLEPGVTLKVQVAAGSTGGTSTQCTFTTTTDSQDLLTGLTKTSAANLMITYVLSIDNTVGETASPVSHQFKFTIQ